MIRTRSLTLVTLLFYSGLSLANATIKENSEMIKCESTKEFVTTVQFLRDKKDFGLDTKSILKIADEISLGCSGSGQRFIKVTRLLSSVGIDTKSALETAKKFAAKDDSFVDAFVTIFKQTYNKDDLDLDALSALKISTQLSIEFNGTVKHAVSDFNSLVNFCKNKKEMDFPLPKCAELATRITRLGQAYNEPIAKPFIELVQFLEENEKGPKRPKNQVLPIAEKVIKNGPIASKNFIQAFKYALAEDGLGFNETEAINFGIKMSDRSFKKL